MGRFCETFSLSAYYWSVQGSLVAVMMSPRFWLPVWMIPIIHCCYDQGCFIIDSNTFTPSRCQGISGRRLARCRSSCSVFSKWPDLAETCLEVLKAITDEERKGLFYDFTLKAVHSRLARCYQATAAPAVLLCYYDTSELLRKKWLKKNSPPFAMFL